MWQTVASIIGGLLAVLLAIYYIETPASDDVILKRTLNTNNSTFYAVAHMALSQDLAGRALHDGANGLELDVKFDDVSGRPARFHHGFPCDCSCLALIPWLSKNNLCKHALLCSASSDFEKQLEFLSQFHHLALIYLDCKTESLPGEIKNISAAHLIKSVEEHLLAFGYNGKILIATAKDKDYLRSAVAATKTSKYSSRFYFTIDQDDDTVASTVEFFQSLGVPNVIYANGGSACFPWGISRKIKIATDYKIKGDVKNVFAWTCDSKRCFEKYYAAGARGIITNNVKKLVDWTKSKRIILSTPDDS